jgi:hypothetical protein
LFLFAHLIVLRLIFLLLIQIFSFDCSPFWRYSLYSFLSKNTFFFRFLFLCRFKRYILLNPLNSNRLFFRSYFFWSSSFSRLSLYNWFYFIYFGLITLSVIKILELALGRRLRLGFLFLNFVFIKSCVLS